MKKFLKYLITLCGYRIIKIHEEQNQKSLIGLLADKIELVSNVKEMGGRINGMVSAETGIYLYLLALFQSEKGDVVEIGSWQGKSSTFLGHATLKSQNGKFYAVDHFSGNKGKEDQYIVMKSDLSDIKDIFTENMRAVGLEGAYELIDENSKVAADKFQEKSIRLLFIDGDHTKNGILTDLEAFRSKLVDGAIIIFDDYSIHFPGLVSVVNQFIQENKYYKCILLDNSLVIKK